MPTRNTVREYDAPAYYHIYNRGAGGISIFVDDKDRIKFTSLLARYLDRENPMLRGDGIFYSSIDIELVAYCLMSSHYHLLVYQESDPEAISELMRSVATAYTMYFNKKYRRSGYLFQGVFKASRITDEPYLQHITRYIHMNPRNYLRYEWSSIAYYLGKEAPSWLNADRVNDMTPEAYREFLKSYESDRVAQNKLIKDLIADN